MRRITGIWLLAAATVLTAGLLSYLASSHPDALEHGMEKHGPDAVGSPAPGASGETGETGATGETGDGLAVMPDYAVPGVKKPLISGGLAGLIGAAATFAAVAGLSIILRARRRGRDGA